MQGTRMWIEAAQMRRQLPFALLATGAVMALPPAVVSLLAPGRGPIVTVPASVALSLIVFRLAAAAWRRHPQSQDILFADLLLWGWLRRVRTERRLSRAATLAVPARPTRGPVEAARRVRALERVSAMIESRDAYTHRHSLRVTRHSEGIARQLGLPEDEVARIRTAAALHDVGKFFIPRGILNKPGKLTGAELAAIKRHSGLGADLLAGVVDADIVAMIRHHHERLDGSGYPDGLAGDAIPLGARIIAVADTFDAMTSTRAYRAARPHQRALDVLREEAGVALDAAGVKAFRAYYSGRKGVYWSTAATTASQGLAPLRELAGPALLSRALPALGASVALTAPTLTGGAHSLTARDSARPAVASAERAPARPAPASPLALPRLARRPAIAAPAGSADRPPRRERRPGAAPPVRAGAHGQRPAGQSGQSGQSAPARPPAASGLPGHGSAPGGSATPAPTATTAPVPSATAQAPAVTPAPLEVRPDGTSVTLPPVTVAPPDLPVVVPTVQGTLPPRLPQ